MSVENLAVVGQILAPMFVVVVVALTVQVRERRYQEGLVREREATIGEWIWASRELILEVAIEHDPDDPPEASTPSPTNLSRAAQWVIAELRTDTGRARVAELELAVAEALESANEANAKMEQAQAEHQQMRERIAQEVGYEIGSVETFASCLSVPDGHLLSVVEAARAAGVSQQAMRKRVDRRTIDWRYFNRRGQDIVGITAGELRKHYPAAEITESGPSPE